MNQFQKTVKYLAMGFAIFLTVVIISGIVSAMALVFSIFNVFNFGENMMSKKHHKGSEITLDDGELESFKNINNIINNNRTCVREENFSEELKKDQMWLEVMAKNHDLQSTQVVADWLDKFDIDNQCRDKSHTDLSDYRKHFNDWLKFKKRNESTKKNKRDGYYEPTATSADDYYNSSF